MFRTYGLVLIISLFSITICEEKFSGYITPWHPRKLRNIEDEFVASVGSSMQLVCKIEDPNDVYVVWTRADNSSLPKNSTVHDGVLLIRNIEPSAAGLYYCLAKSSQTHQVLSTLKARIRVVVPPHITLTPRRQIIRPGDKVVISCAATGDPPIQISWAVYGRKFPKNVKIIGRDLVFTNIDPSDAGTYKCNARNMAGEAEAVVEINVDT